MYSKYLIVASKNDRAGMNITTQMSQFKSDFNFYFVEGEIIQTENLDLNKINQYDFIIFASRHRSEKKQKSVSVHAVGNFRNAEFGGKTGKLGKTSAVFLKQFFEKLNSNAEQFHLEDYSVTMECTHHGPLIDKPCIFAEIGSTETEWRDTKAAFVVAKTIYEMIEEFEPNPYNEIAIGIGGPHYCPNFNKVQLKSNVALSHIIPQYSFPVTEDMIKEAIESTEEEIDLFVLDWKGLGPAEHREQLMEVLKKFYIQTKKTSDISKEEE